MRRSEIRKANIVLAKAREYVASYTSKPKQEKIEQKPKYYQVKNAEIVKLSKGHFSVIAELVSGQTIEIPKRFKSVTKASLWVNKYKI